MVLRRIVPALPALTALALSGVAGGCKKPAPTTDGNTPTDSHPTSDTTDTDTTASTGTSGTTGETGTTITEPPIDCSNLPTGLVNYGEMRIETTEDFDFDAQGYLVYAEWLGSNLIGADAYGNSQIIATGVHDTRGISVMSDGNIAVAYISEGRVGITDRATGVGTTMVSGLNGPNALELDYGDIMYVTEFGRVLRYDMATDDIQPIATGFSYPNGLTLDEDHDTLYISDTTNGIYRIEKITDTEWTTPELVVDPSGGFGSSYDAMEVDACGNVYVLGFYTGELYRFDPVTLESVLLARIQDSGAFLWNAIHWGSGIGGWRRDVLYVTDRNKIFGVEVGVMGRDQPVDLVP